MVRLYHPRPAHTLSPTDDLLSYQLIIVPSLVLVDEAIVAKLQKASERGATVVITCMTGLRTPEMKSFGSMLNKQIASLAGISMEEQFSLIKQETTAIQFGNNINTQTCSQWFDVFNPLQTIVLATYQSRFLKGKPTIVRNNANKGAVYYIGTIPSDELTDMVIKAAVSDAKIVPLATANNKLVDITELQQGKKRYAYLINFSQEPQPITISKPMKDILSGEKLTQQTTVAPMEVKVLEVGQE